MNRFKKVLRKRYAPLPLAALLALVGALHTNKALPEGLAYRGEERPVRAGDVLFLADLTYGSVDGRVREQEIFDRLYALIDGAEHYILVDMFLFNSFTGPSRMRLRGLAGELAARLAARKRSLPSIKVDVVTDPINIVYGGVSSPELNALREAGVNVILTDLDPLRDSNPLYSSFWRVFLQWFGNSSGRGLLPHPFSTAEEGVTLRSYLAMFNFKANHRKILVADSGGEMITVVTSANPHDGSSAHSNVAFQVAGSFWEDVYEAERAVARLSGGELSVPPGHLRRRAAQGGEGAAVVLTEERIEEALMDMIDGTGRGDRLWLAMFYIGDRDIMKSLLAASGRGASIRLVLDPNRDAFGYEKKGIPNRPAAAELVDESEGRIEVRWYRTEGEQFHSKLVFLARTGGEATALLGSANLTRRNLDGYNLELDVALTLPLSSKPMGDVGEYLLRIWENRGGTFTDDYGRYADDSAFRAILYRVQEGAGLGSF